MTREAILDTATFLSLPKTEKFVQLAANHCDVLKAHEDPMGSNSGPWVDTYLKAAGLEPGYPWCASFVTYLLKTIGEQWLFTAVRGSKNPRIEHPAAVASWAHWARATGRITTSPRRGDLFFILHPNGTGHIGIVLEDKGQTVRTIEGNTNTDGSREGWEVCRRERSKMGLSFISLWS